jgi:hypothetical protein
MVFPPSHFLAQIQHESKCNVFCRESAHDLWTDTSGCGAKGLAAAFALTVALS